MKASATKKNGILHFYFDGELDEHAARLIRRQTDAFYSIPAYFADVGTEADKVLSLSGVYTVVPKLPPSAGQACGKAGRESGVNGGRRA